MTGNQLAGKCGELVRTFASLIHALHFSECREKKLFIFTLITNLSKIEFVYIGKGSMVCPPSTVFVRIFPLKTREVPFHLYELMNDGDFRCTYFTHIESEQRMELCFNALSGILLEYLPKIEALVGDRERFNALVEEKYETVKKFLNIKDGDIPTGAEEAPTYWRDCFRFFERFVQLVHFTQWEGYGFFLEGCLEKAKAFYEKQDRKGNLLPYDKRLYQFIQIPKAENYNPISSECAATFDAKRYTSSKAQRKQMLKKGGIVYLLLLIFFAVIGLIIELVRARDTAYYSFMCYILAPFAALMPSVFGAISLRRILVKLTNKKEWEKELAFDDILNSKAVNRAAHVAFGITFGVCLFFMVIFSCASSRFYTNRMVYDDAENFPLLHPVTYFYEDIDTVYHIAGRHNDFGDYIGRGSYVLCFQDGAVIDLDGTLFENETRKHVLPLLEPYIDDVIDVYSDRDIPLQG